MSWLSFALGVVVGAVLLVVLAVILAKQKMRAAPPPPVYTPLSDRLESTLTALRLVAEHGDKQSARIARKALSADAQCANPTPPETSA